MDIILTSFGLGMEESEDTNPFYRLPPFFVDSFDGISFDYATFLLFDRVIIDEASFDRVLNFELRNLDQFPRLIRMAMRAGQVRYNEFLKAMQSAGRLVLEDFNSKIQRHGGLIRDAVDYDMANLTTWSTPLEQSLSQWNKILRLTNERWCYDQEHRKLYAGRARVERLAHTLASPMGSIMGCIEVLKNWKKKQVAYLREEARSLLRDYLSYINTNILLSHVYDSPFLDWNDLQPFYSLKFRLACRAQQDSYQDVENVKKLFDLVFPFFVPTSAKKFVRALEDRRIEELRALVHRATKGEITFDKDFALRTLQETFRLEQKAILRRKVSGWITLPLGLIPILGSGVQKASEELMNRMWSNRPLNEKEWFYLITEVDTKSVL